MSELTLGSLFDGNYLITNDGKVYSTRSNKWLRPNTDKYGYLYYVVSIDGVRYTFKAHRAVAECFLPNPDNKPTVDHINGNKQDNRVCNLRWATNKEQSRNPITYSKLVCNAKERDFHAMGAIRNWGRKPVRVTKDGSIVGEYPSLMAAASALSINYPKASECVNGKRKTVGGYKIWPI